jgi:hypothetical protein
LTDPTNTGTLIYTDDPTGTDILFIVDNNGSNQGALTIFTLSTSGVSYTIRPVQQSIPEPSSLAFCAAGLLVSSLLIRRRQK